MVAGLTATLTAGNGCMFKVMLLVWLFTQLGVPALATLMILIVVLEV